MRGALAAAVGSQVGTVAPALVAGFLLQLAPGGGDGGSASAGAGAGSGAAGAASEWSALSLPLPTSPPAGVGSLLLDLQGAGAVLSAAVFALPAVGVAAQSAPLAAVVVPPLRMALPATPGAAAATLSVLVSTAPAVLGFFPTCSAAGVCAPAGNASRSSVLAALGSSLALRVGVSTLTATGGMVGSISSRMSMWVQASCGW